MRFHTPALTALALLVALAPGLAQVRQPAATLLRVERPPVIRTVQSAAVLAHYPPLDLPMTSPALTPGRTTFTTQAEMEAYLADLTTAPETSAHVAALTLGTTPGGRQLPALLLSREGARTPAELARLGRPIVWLIGQQHGNEPAGGEALLVLAKALAGGELRPVLDRLSVVIIPRANPDGAALGTRENLSGHDLNRDHGVLSQPEVQLMHSLLRQLPPALVIDAHEFTVGQRWLAKLGGLQSTDLMVLSATHPMVAEPVRKLATEVFAPALEAAVARHKLTTFVYHTMAVRTANRSISTGGNATGIARNAFGLMGAVSFLLETRGVGVGFDAFQRRVATHVIAARALLETAATNADLLAATVAAARADAAHSQTDIIVGQVVAKRTVQLPLIEPVRGTARRVTVEMLDTRVITAIERRTRPAGYVIPPNRAAAMVKRLAQMGAATCLLSRAFDTAIERYQVVSRSDTDARAINPGRGVRVRVLAGRATLAAGSLFVPLAQAEGTMLALALEPDAPGSLSASELLGLDAGSTVAPASTPTPILALRRLPQAALTPEFEQALVCDGK